MIEREPISAAHTPEATFDQEASFTAACDYLLQGVVFEPSTELRTEAWTLLRRLCTPDGLAAVSQEDWQAFGQHVERTVERAQDYTDAQIGALLYKAALFHASRHVVRYLEELADAEEYAYQSGRGDLSERLLAAWTHAYDEEATPGMRLVYQLRHDLPPDEYRYVVQVAETNLAYEVLEDLLYGVLVDAGVDADALMQRAAAQ